MFTLVISCLTISNLHWFMDLTFQVPTFYIYIYIFFFSTAWISISPWAVSTCVSFMHWPRPMIRFEVISNYPPLFPNSILDTFQPWRTHLPIIYFCLFILPWGSCGRNNGVVGHCLLQWRMFCQNSSLWLTHLGLSCIACLISSLNEVSSFFMTQLWSTDLFLFGE